MQDKPARKLKLVSVIQLRVTQPNPQHIGIIMDGNRRWAKQFGLPAAFGHASGARRVRSIVQACADRGLRFTPYLPSAPKTGSAHRMKCPA